MDPYYQDNWATIYHGDCLDILPQLDPVDLVLTDPPYGVGFKYHDNYDDSRRDYAEWAQICFRMYRQLSRITMLTTGMRNLWLYPQPDWVLCWAKPGSTRNSGLGGFNEWEPVLIYGKPRIYNDFKYLPDCVNHLKGKSDHPCPKPLGLYKWLIKQAGPINTILDPFMGSGTALRAAKDLAVKSIGIEIEESYCEIAVERLRQDSLLGLIESRDHESIHPKNQGHLFCNPISGQ